MSNEHPNAKIAPGGSLVLSVVGSVAAWLSRGALADAEYSLKKAREIGQAATLMFALAFTSFTHILCGHYAIANIQSDELAAVAHQKGTLWGVVNHESRLCIGPDRQSLGRGSNNHRRDHRMSVNGNDTVRATHFVTFSEKPMRNSVNSRTLGEASAKR
jgi:hypothetical protein